MSCSWNDSDELIELQTICSQLVLTLIFLMDRGSPVFWLWFRPSSCCSCFSVWLVLCWVMTSGPWEGVAPETEPLDNRCFKNKTVGPYRFIPTNTEIINAALFSQFIIIIINILSAHLLLLSFLKYILHPYTIIVYNPDTQKYNSINPYCLYQEPLCSEF